MQFQLKIATHLNTYDKPKLIHRSMQNQNVHVHNTNKTLNTKISIAYFWLIYFFPLNLHNVHEAGTFSKPFN
jgi:hypothetical protein